MRSTPLVIVFITVFIALIGFGIVIPLLPVYANRFGASGSMIGILMMSYSLMQFILSPFAGRLSDRIGRRPVLIISLIITTFSYILFGLATDLTTLLISRILAGIGGSDITVAQAYIADVTTPQNRAKGMGLFGSAFNIGFIVGPFLGGVLAPLGHGAPAFAAAGFSGITSILALTALPEPQQHARTGKKSINVFRNLDQALMIVILVYFFIVFAQSQLQSMIVLFNVNHFHWAERENGYYLGMVGVVAACVQGGLIGFLSRKFGQRRLVIAGALLIGIGMWFISLVGRVSLLITGGMINAIGFALVMPSLSSMASLSSPRQLHGQVLRLYQSAGSLGRILAPVTGGLLFDKLSPSAPFFSGASLAALIFLFSLKFLKQPVIRDQATEFPEVT